VNATDLSSSAHFKGGSGEAHSAFHHGCGIHVGGSGSAAAILQICELHGIANNGAGELI
jgi:hypothetical protein